MLAQIRRWYESLGKGNTEPPKTIVAGVEDTPDNMYNYLVQETGEAVHEDTLRLFCKDSPGLIDWLMARGAPFKASMCPFKTSYPSNKYYYYYSGNESFAPYTDSARAAPRGHRAHGKGVSGAALFNPLQAAAEKQGVDILYQHRVTGLVVDERGHTLGVRARKMPDGSATAWSASTRRGISRGCPWAQ